MVHETNGYATLRILPYKYSDWKVERHRIMIPTLKNVRLKEYGYIPVGAKVISGTVSKKADRYYVSVIVDIDAPIIKNTNKGIGIDLGLKDFAICSDGNIYKNINKTQRIRKLEKKLKREQKRLSRKYEFLKKFGFYNQNLKKIRKMTTKNWFIK